MVYTRCMDTQVHDSSDTSDDSLNRSQLERMSITSATSPQSDSYQIANNDQNP